MAMYRPLFLGTVTCLIVCATAVVAQQRGGGPGNGGASAPPEAISAQEAFDALNVLNQKQALLAPFVGSRFQYTGLRADNTFGIRWPDGQRLIGESSGTHSMNGTIDAENVALIGFLLSDGAVTLGGAAVEPGSYGVWVGPTDCC